MTRLEVACRMAIVFRDKYDFSSEEDYAKWVERSFKAADLMLAEDAKKALEPKEAK